MSNDDNTTTQPENTENYFGMGRKPDLGAFEVKNINDKAHWTLIGSGWTHESGNGLDLQLGDQHIILLKLRDEKMQQFEEERQAQQKEPQQSVKQSQSHEPTR